MNKINKHVINEMWASTCQSVTSQQPKFNAREAILYCIYAAVMGFIGAILAADCQYWFL